MALPSAPRFVWLLDVDGPGVQLRYASEAVEASGVRYRAGLADLEVAQGDTADVSVTDPSVDWPSLSAGLPLAACVLRRWQIGTGLATAETYVLGVARDVEHATSADPVAWTIVSGDVPMPPCPDPHSQVDLFTSPSEAPVGYPTLILPPKQNGVPYPIVFGYPGFSTAALRSDTETWPVVPVPLRQQVPHGSFGLTSTEIADVANVVVSEDPVTTTPTDVFLYDTEAEEGASQSCTYDTDKRGRRLVVADFVDHTEIYPSVDGAQLYAGYYPAADPTAIRDAYSVLEYMLRRFGGTSVDWDLMPDARDVLEPYLVDSYLNTDVGDVWQWVEAVFGQTLPIAIRTSSRGRYIQALRFTVDSRRTARTIDVQRSGATRAAPVRWSGAVQNEFVAQFADTPDAGYVRLLNLGVFGDGLVDAFTHGLCVASQARYGVRPAPNVQIPWAWDDGTALRVLTWRAERDALPARLVQYQVPEHLRLREGVQVRLVDADVGLADLAIVEGPPVVGGAGGMVVTFRIPGRA